APSTSASSSTSDMHHPVRHEGIAEEPTLEDSSITHDVLHPSFNPVTGEPGSAQSLSGNVNSEDGPKIILLITSLAIPLVLYLPENS
ncbi:hypothetical protein Tco_0575648, partial [Tanacetum coccineum]